MKAVKKIFLTFAVITGFLSLKASLVSAQSEAQTYEGEVLRIVSTGQEEIMDEYVGYQELEIKLTTKDKKGEVITIKNSESSMGLVTVDAQQYSPEDKLRLSFYPGAGGEGTWAIEGLIKRDGLIVLLLLFVITVIAVGRLWGALSLVGLLTSFIVIFKLIIPLIIRGVNPVFAAVLGSAVIVPTTFYISHGFNKKTHVGVATTLIGLVFTGFMAVYFVNATHLTGYASEEAGFLQVERQGSIDIRGLLLAGIIIGTLGILDDVTIGQASTVEQLKKANRKMGAKELFQNGMKVGQDHISSMVNTLVLVYSGSALPLLLLFFGSDKSFIDIVEFELIAEEIVRMLVGSIGLVLSAPLATIIAAWVFEKEHAD